MDKEEEIVFKNKLQVVLLVKKNLLDQVELLKQDVLFADRLGVSNPVIESKKIGIVYLEYVLSELNKNPEDFLEKQ